MPVIRPLRCRVVVPCHNEAERLDADAFHAFAAANPHVTFLLVDDGSTDGTLAVLSALAARRSTSFEVLALTPNRGKGEAVRAGLRQALSGQCDAVGYWDADLATPLDAFPLFHDLMRDRPEVEIVMGARVKLLGRDVDRPWNRHVFGRVAATAASSILHLPVYDTQCGAKLLRKTDTLKRLLQRPFLSRWAFDVELLKRWLVAHDNLPEGDVERRIVEIPLHSWHDVRGSKVTAADMAKAPLDLLRIWWDGGRVADKPKIG